MDSSVPNLASQQQNGSSIDFVSRLLNVPHVLEKIFSFLRPKDLRVVPVVSRNWCEAVYHVTPIANKRRVKALKHLKRVKRNVGVENWPIYVDGAILKRKLRNREARALQRLNSPQEPLIQRLQRQPEQQQPPLPIPMERSPLRMFLEIQNTGRLNYNLPKRRSADIFQGDDDHPKEGRNKPRWILAQEPFKKW